MKKNMLLGIALSRLVKKKVLTVSILLFVSLLLVFSGIWIFGSGENVMIREMERVGFGDICLWLSGDGQKETENLNKNDAVEKIETQNIIFADYEINGHYSDNEGQIIAQNQTFPYRIIDEKGNELRDVAVSSGEVYISPVLLNTFDAHIGDLVNFELSRSNGIKSYTIAGFYEDPFMGSSMIDMKGFLISETDYSELKNFILSAKSSDVLGETGCMVHISGTAEYANELKKLQSQIAGDYMQSGNIKFSYNRDSIKNYMLLLSNILSGFMLAAGVFTMIAVLVLITNVNESIINKEEKNLASLKTVGVKGKAIVLTYLGLWNAVVILISLIAVVFSFFICNVIERGMVSSTGLYVHIDVPLLVTAAVVVSVLVFCDIAIFIKLRILMEKMPKELLNMSQRPLVSVRNRIEKDKLIFDLAVRDLLSGLNNYIGTIIVAFVLVVFLGMIGRMGNWLGSNGEGLMNTFSVAEHDVGVQPFNDAVPMDEIERVINWYSPIKAKYELAMQSVTVNGNEYTANILNDTSYFHLLEGRVCQGNEILVTDTVASELGVNIGDVVGIANNGRYEEYKVSGIYQCANGMGTNIGMDMSGYSQIGDITGFIWCHHYILENGNIRDYCVNYLQKNYRGIDVHTNSWSGLDGIVVMMHMVMAAIYVIAALFVTFAVWLNAKSIIEAEEKNLAILKGLGLRTITLRRAFAMRFLIVAALGAVIGSIVSGLFANRIILIAFRMIGIGEFTEGISILGVIIPFLFIPILFSVSAYLLSGKIKKISILNIIRER